MINMDNNPATTPEDRGPRPGGPAGVDETTCPSANGPDGRLGRRACGAGLAAGCGAAPPAGSRSGSGCRSCW